MYQYENDSFYPKLKEWLENFVEVPNEKLNGWSPCPYAKQARTNNKIKCVELNPDSIFYSILIHLDSLNDQFDVIVFYTKSDKISADTLVGVTSELNRYKNKSGFVFLEDHPDNEEFINGVKMNFGEYALILAQRLDALTIASEKLKNKGYYDIWSNENLEDVVIWRNK